MNAMKKLLILFISLLAFSCKKESSPNQNNSIGQNLSVLVTPKQTDVNYAETQESHYIVRNTNTHVNKLLLFIGGSFSVPKNYQLICNHAASIGLDVISLSYPNNVPAATLGTSTDPYVFDNYRDEVCFGNQVSNAVTIDNLNSIATRTLKLILFLNATYPDQNWKQYLTSANTLEWSKIIVAGHSQGSGHACYLAKKEEVERVVMLSGPNDYSTYFNSPANWLSQSGKTPLIKQFALLHSQDEIASFSYQVSNLRAIGLLDVNQNPVLADNLTTPYSNKHALSLNIPAISYHNSTVGSNAILPDIWTYMLIK